MIRYVKGDATEPEGDGIKIIAHCCNNIGGWGSGFVLALNKKWWKPKERFLRMPKILGMADLVPVDPDSDVWVANIIGQRGVKGPGNPRPIDYDALECGLRVVAQYAKHHNASVHMPRLGCGLAGGSWAVVEEIISNAFFEETEVVVYDFPGGKFNP